MHPTYPMVLNPSGSLVSSSWPRTGHASTIPPGTCLIQSLKQQISSIAKITAIQVLVQYQTVPNIEADLYDDTKI